MRLRPAGALLLSLLVLAPGVALVRRQQVPATRVAKLRTALPMLARTLSFRQQSLDQPGFFHDPFLRESPDDAYDRGLAELLGAHEAMAEKKLTWTDSAAAVANAEAHVLEIQERLDRARFIERFGFDASDRTGRDEALLQLWTKRLAAARTALKVAEQRVIEANRDASAMEARLKPLGSKYAAEGPLIERNGLLVLFRDGTPVARIIDVLKRHRLAGSEVGTSGLIFFVRSADHDEEPPTDAGESARLRGIAANLERAEASTVLAATVNMVLGDTSVPRPTGRDWFNGRDPLVISGFPGAWNFNDAIRRSTRRVAVGVLDVGFHCTKKITNPDLSITCYAPPNEQQGVDEHGHWVAGIIGAEFGNGHLVDGAAPFTKIYGCSAGPVKKVEGDTEEEVEFNRIGNTAKNFIACLDRLAVVPVAVINASVGYNWRKNHGIRPHLKGPGPPLDEKERRAELAQQTVEDHGEMVRTSLRVASSNLIVVSAAGNDFGDPAIWSSPFNWAALGTSSNGTRAAENVIIVEALEATGTSRAPLSNVGGMIQAISQNIPTLVVENKKERPARCPEGTSCAAPLVTAAVAQMLGVGANLTPDAVKKGLGITGTGADKLKAAEAVRAIAADADLANYGSDLIVDMIDFQVFRMDFKDFETGRTTGIFRVDLNRDGVPDAKDAFFCRSDFDGDKDIDKDDLEIMIGAWSDTSVDRATLRATLQTLLRQ